MDSRWWIGQVTDPVKGKWKDSMEKTRAKNRGEKSDGEQQNYNLDVEFAS